MNAVELERARQALRRADYAVRTVKRDGRLVTYAMRFNATIEVTDLAHAETLARAAQPARTAS